MSELHGEYRRALADDYRLRALVESMVRDGASEDAIVVAVNDAAGEGRPTRRVLIAEDETLIRLDLSAVLGAAGFDVCAEAADGLQAVQLALEHRPDAIVMDANMPRLDGVSAARRILEVRRVPIVMLTAYNYGELVDRALDAGIFRYLVKPFREQEVIDAVSAALPPFPG